MYVKLIVLTALFAIGIAAPIALSLEEEWAKFKTDYNKVYGPEEEQNRFKIFQENFDRIKEHNEKYARGETTFTQGINKFADLTQEEFAQKHLGLIRPGVAGLA